MSRSQFQLVENQGLAATRLREALKYNDRETAERIAHALKGLVGSTGAERLQQSSARLEALLLGPVTGRTNLKDSINQFDTETEDKLNTLRKGVRDNRLLSILDQVQQLVRKYDYEQALIRIEEAVCK